MVALRKLLALPAAERLLLAKAFVLVAAFRAGLALLPFRVLWRVSAGRAAAKPARAGDPSRVAWAVMVASNLLPGTTCLAQALAAHMLLGWYGLPAQLRIGVAHGPAGQLEAHAWAESNGQIVVGGTSESLARYSVMPLESNPL